MENNKKIKSAILIFIIMLILVASLYFIDRKNVEQKYSEIEVLAENLDTPWAIDFLPHGNLIFTERYGRVSILEDEEIKIVANINVNELSESGLLGIAVDPEFEKNKLVYVYYTHENGNRISRFILNDKFEDEFILLDNIPNARFHDGGRLKFGPDGKLYITTGDATLPSSAQDINSLAGKILRMNKDGTIPEDNPFHNYAYSYGHRNPQGLAWHPVSKQLYASEHGPTKNDEINIIVKGQNYGWPTECDGESGYQKPLRCFSEFTLAPSGIGFYNNDLYAGGLRGTQIRKFVLDKNYMAILNEEELFSEFGRIRDVVEHEGYLYIATSNRDGRGIPKPNDDKIMRVKLA